MDQHGSFVGTPYSLYLEHRTLQMRYIPSSCIAIGLLDGKRDLRSLAFGAESTEGLSVGCCDCCKSLANSSVVIQAVKGRVEEL